MISATDNHSSYITLWLLLVSIEWVPCHAMKNNIKNHSVDKIKKLWYYRWYKDILFILCSVFCMERHVGGASQSSNMAASGLMIIWTEPKNICTCTFSNSLTPKMLTSLFTFLLIYIRLCAQKKTCYVQLKS